MKNTFITNMLAFILLSACQNHQPTHATTPHAHHPIDQHTLIITYDATIGKSAIIRAIKQHEAVILYDYKNFNTIAIRLPLSADPQSVKQKLAQVNGVLAVQFNGFQQLH